jgi:hypothetical protein
MSKRWGIGFVVLLAVGSSRSAMAGCEKDTDCKGDRICEADACVSPDAPAAVPAPPVAIPATPSEVAAPATEGEAAAPATEGEVAAPATEGEAAAPATEGEAAAPATEGEAAAEDLAWWKRHVRDAEAPRLQEIFNEVPRPIRKKGATTLIYQRAVPIVISDIHDTTAVWGSKLQPGVHFLGISKVHTTPALESVTPDSNGVVYCPLNCSRIQTVTAPKNDIVIVYDGPIKDWAGTAADNMSGYVRKFGKANKSICSFPLMYNHAPPNTWLDEDEVKKVKVAAVDEIKRYCEL